jgi:hypothetical protein
MEGTEVEKLILSVCKPLMNELDIHGIVEGDCVHSLDFWMRKGKLQREKIRKVHIQIFLFNVRWLLHVPHLFLKGFEPIHQDIGRDSIVILSLEERAKGCRRILEEHSSDKVRRKPINVITTVMVCSSY